MLRYEKESYEIIGAAIEVHKQLGCGFLEAVYQEAFEIELQLRNILYKREEKLQIHYKGRILNKYYIADFICFDGIIVEIKALNLLEKSHEAQLLNYLKATSFGLRYMINFGEQSLKYKRLIYN